MSWPPSLVHAILCVMTNARSARFVGRVDEISRLLDLLERAERGEPSVALVAGDAGVGKSRLLAELAARAEARGARVLIGGCMEAGDVGLPYVPFVDALRDLGTRAGEADLVEPLVEGLPSLGRLLPDAVRAPVPALASGDGFDRVQLFNGLRSLLVRLSELAPLVLIIEDLHWADRSTRDLLAFLVRALRGDRIAVVASYRSDELHRRHPLRPFLAELVRVPDLERIELAPFNRLDLAAHLEALTGEQVPAPALDRILERSEGNAFFAEELVAAGAIRDDVALPESLADVLLGRVEALPELAREVLNVAAVAGRRVGHELLVAAAGRPEPELERGLRDAIAARLLVLDPDTETYRFRHALLQEVVYGDLLPGERGRLHESYAKLLAGRGPAAELAWHYKAGHDLRNALSALVRAAAEATAVAAPAEAYRHLTEALALWDRVPDAQAAACLDRVELLLRAAEAASTAGAFRRAVQLAREALAGIDQERDPLRAAGAYERLGHYLLDDVGGAGGATPEEVIDACTRAVELVPADPPTRLRARVTAELARVLLNTERLVDARRWCDEALAVAAAAGSTADEIDAMITLAVLEQRDSCGVERARSILRAARARAAATGNHALELRAVHNLGQVELEEGDLPAASTLFDEALALAERTGLSWSGFGISTRSMRCMVLYAAGDWDAVERLAAPAEERDTAVAEALGTFVAASRGAAGAAERLDALTRMDNDPWGAYLAGGCAADLARWHGEHERARELVESMLAAIDAAGDQYMLSVIWPAALGVAAEAGLAEAARAAGDADAAAAVAAARKLLKRVRSTLDSARASNRQIGPEARAWAARTEAEFARVEGRLDVERWAAAAAAFAYGYVYEEAACRWRLAEALLAAGRRDEAACEAGKAHAAALRLGAGPLRAAVEDLARRGRLDLGAGGRPGGSPEQRAAEEGAASLTPRELEVLRLVAAGRSNGQIAEELFISPKTASVHVSNILAKFGVHTRTEAAATAHRLGLD
jgi:DNA-binding CsgD family transcriptional regulator/tetratricopeptide (TPR) repeat protein